MKYELFLICLYRGYLDIFKIFESIRKGLGKDCKRLLTQFVETVRRT
jgi:hypothetical protein